MNNLLSPTGLALHLTAGCLVFGVAGSVRAAILNNPPTSGQTVSVTGSNTGNITAPAANNVLLELPTGAVLDSDRSGTGAFAVVGRNDWVVEIDGTLNGNAGGAIGLDNDARVNNRGLITGSYFGIKTESGARVDNSGTMDVGVGVFGDNMTVNNSGQITADWTQGITGSNNTVTNTGTITSKNSTVFDPGRGNVTNSGTLSSQNFSGVYAQVEGILVNTGTITGKASAVRIDGLGLIVNSGTISGEGGIHVAGANSQITNRGTITATDPNGLAVFLDSNTSRLVLEPGSVINGDADGGILVLGGDGASGSFNADRFADQYSFGELIKEGTSTWTLTGSSARPWTVTGGNLVGDTDSLQSDIENNAAVVFDQAADGTYGGTLSGTGSLTKSGSGTLTLTAANTYSGGTTLAAGTLGLGHDNALGTGTLTVVGDATLDGGSVFRELGNATVLSSGSQLTTRGRSTFLSTGDISGDGGLIVDMQGFASLALRGTNTFTGDVLVQGGNLVADSDHALPDTAIVTLADAAGAGFHVQADVTVGGLTGGGAAGGNVMLLHPDSDPVSLTVSNASDHTFAGLIFGQGGRLIKDNTAALTLTGDNTYSGGTTLAAGTLGLGQDNALGTGTLTVAGDATITSTDDDRSVANAVTLDTGHTLSVGGDHDLLLRGIVAGDGSLTKTGSGLLRLTGDSSYTGGTTLRDGILSVGHANALGTGTLTIEGGTLLESFFANDISVVSDFSVGPDVSGYVATFGSVDLNSAARTVTIIGNGQWRPENTIHNGSLTLDGGAAYFLDTASSSLESLTVNSRLVLARNAIAPETDLTIGSTGSVRFYDAATIESIAGDGVLKLQDPHDNTLTIIGNRNTLFTGDIEDYESASGRSSPTTSGTLVHAGTGSLTLTGDTTAVDFRVTNGTLVLNGTGTGDATVDGGRLGGSGTIGNLTATRGTVAPGNSIGTLNVNGDVTLGQDSVYDVEVSADGTSDRIAATGSATLETGTTFDVSVINGGGMIRNDDTWTVLTADGGITDDGARVTTDFAGYRFDGDILGNTYRLTATATALAPLMTDGSARRVAAALDRDAASGRHNAELGRFIESTRNQSFTAAQLTLNATTPGPVASSRVAQQRVTERFHVAVGNYLEGRRLGAPQLVNRDADRYRPGQFQLASAADDPRTLALMLDQTDPAADDPLRTDLDPAVNSGADGWGGFAATYGVYDDFDPAPDRLGSRANTYAGQVGVDYTFERDITLGFSFSYAASDLDFDGQTTGPLGSSDIDTYRVGPYLGVQRGPWSAEASVTYALHENDAQRTNPTSNDVFRSDYNSHDVAAFFSGGYRIDLDGWSLRPEAGLQYVYAWSDDFEEQGGPGALAVDDADADSLRSTVGLGLSRRFEVGGAVLVPHAEVGWAHEYLDDAGTLTARFVGGSSPFTLATAGRDDDSLYYGAGLTALIQNNTALDLTYSGETFNDGQTHALRLALRINF